MLAGVLDQLPVEHVADELLPVLAAHAEPHALDGAVVDAVERAGGRLPVGVVDHADARRVRERGEDAPSGSRRR